MNIGIFGGSFNPPHMGHLIVAESVRDQLRLDKILFIPAAQSPNKPDTSLAVAKHRLEMTELAVKGCTGFEVSNIEIERKGLSYTVDTVQALAALYPNSDLSLIIGSDNLIEFEAWKSPDEIVLKANLIVMSRPGFSPNMSKSKYLRSAKIVNVPQVGISGTDIRRKVKLGRSIRFLVPKSVEDYILTKRLYKD
ncbi:MAG: nicotinate-nucleotide adenylyltransferase [Ignavibacteriales bacterium]|nr:nicotinate-nucleotide adenylyltransferase [Ignavibacteriales bacterium]